MWYQLIIFILINSGLSIGISRSKLTESFRNKIKEIHEWAGSMISCVMCSAFWTSTLVYVYVYKIVDYNLIGFMFIGSITAYLLNSISNTIKFSQ